jgi:hypothetical protein
MPITGSAQFLNPADLTGEQQGRQRDDMSIIASRPHLKEQTPKSPGVTSLVSVPTQTLPCR